jgi:hypothetical protein
MKRFDSRVVLGGALIFLGLLMLLERMGLLQGAANLFWGAILALAGAFFLYRFAAAPRDEWWAAIPGFALAGLGIQSLLARALDGWDGLIFLGFLGLGFWAVYFSGRERWWAIIPGGVLVTLGLVSVLDNVFPDAQTGGLFFLGLGLTFLLVGLLASMNWAYIPAGVLIVLSLALWSPLAGATNYVLPIVFVAAGLMLIYRFYRAQ